MNTYEATIRVGSSLVKVQVQANTSYQAKEIIKMQYGTEPVTGIARVY